MSLSSGRNGSTCMQFSLQTTKASCSCRNQRGISIFISGGTNLFMALAKREVDVYEGCFTYIHFVNIHLLTV